MSRTKDELEKENEALKAEVEDLKEENEDLTAALDTERRTNEAARDLHGALTTYLSWVDSPPTNFDGAQYADILRRFRSSINDAMSRMDVP